MCNIRFRNDLPEVGVAAAAQQPRRLPPPQPAGRRFPAAGALRPSHTRTASLSAACPLAAVPLQIPCDPKMLLPPLNQAELGAFSLTSLEREMKRDMLFEPDLGIPITVLDIDRYTIPYAGPHEKPALHPKDAELLKVCMRGPLGLILKDVRAAGSRDWDAHVVRGEAQVGPGITPTSPLLPSGLRAS